MTLPNPASFSSYVGAPAFIDAAPVTDPNTDLGADGANQALTDVAMMTRTAVRAWVAFAYEDGYWTVQDHDAVWGKGFDVVPTIVRVSLGVFEITWPATVTDQLGETKAVNLSRLKAGHVESTHTAYIVNPKRTGPNTGRVYIFDDSLGSAEPTDADIYVEAV